MSDYIIRDMQESDLERVSTLYSDMYKEQKDFGMIMNLRENDIPSLLASQLKSKLHLILVLDCGGILTGFIAASIVKLQKKYYLEGQDFIGFIHDIYIKPDYRHSQWATKLLTDMESRLQGLGIRYIELQVLENNPTGQQFWSKMGYEGVIRVMYKHI